jgi:hypothetical protein
MFRLASFTTRQLNGIGVNTALVVAFGPGLTTFTAADGVYYGSWYDQSSMNMGFLPGNASYTTISTALYAMMPGDTFVICDGAHLQTLTLKYDPTNPYQFGSFSPTDYSQYIDFYSSVNESNPDYQNGSGRFAGTISSIAIPLADSGKTVIKQYTGNINSAPAGTILSLGIGSSMTPGPNPTYVLQITVTGTGDENTDIYNMYSGTIEIRTSDSSTWTTLTITGQEASRKLTNNPPYVTIYSITTQETLTQYNQWGTIQVYGLRYTPGTNGTHPGGGGGGPVTALLISYPEPNGFYNSSNHSSSFPPGPYTDGMFLFQSGTDRDAFVTAAPTTVTFNDSYGGNSWTITGVSNITTLGPDAMSISWTSTTMTGAYSGPPSLTYTSGGGGGSAQAYSGGPFNIISVNSMNFPTVLTVTFSSSTEAAEFALAVTQEPTMSTTAYYNNQVWNFVAGAAIATESVVVFSTLTNGQQMYQPSATNYIIGTKVTSANINLNNYYASDFNGGPGTLTFQSSSSNQNIFDTLIADGANGLASLIIYDGVQRSTNYAFEGITNVTNPNYGGNPSVTMSFTSSTSFPNFGTPGIMLGSYVVIPSGTTGGGGSATYTSGTDYSNGMSGPPGIYLMGAPGDYAVQLASQWWTTTAGYDALYALTSGGTFTITMPTTGSTSYTITLTSSWSPGSYPMATFTSSEPLSLMGGASSVPATVTVASSGGGGSSNTFTQSGNWETAYWASYGNLSISLSMSASSAFLAKLNSTQDNITSITLVDTSYGSTTFTVQHISGLPVTTGSYVSIYTPSPPGGVSWNQITSITFN